MSSFVKANVVENYFMFSRNYLLKSLDLSNFDTSNVVNRERILVMCSSLEYLNFINAIETDNLEYKSIFKEIPENIVCYNILLNFLLEINT